MAADGQLARRLKVARVEAGLGVTEAAERIGVSRQALSGWEREGGSDPSDENLDRAAEVYGKPIAWLRYGSRAYLQEMQRAQQSDRPAGSGGRNGRAAETGPGFEAFAPNPRYRGEIPPRAYAVGLGYLERLQRAGVGREEIEEAERLLFDSRYAKLNKRERGELSEEDHILLIEAGWDIIREVLSWQGIRP